MTMTTSFSSSSSMSHKGATTTNSPLHGNASSHPHICIFTRFSVYSPGDTSWSLSRKAKDDHLYKTQLFSETRLQSKFNLFEHLTLSEMMKSYFSSNSLPSWNWYIYTSHQLPLRWKQKLEKLIQPISDTTHIVYVGSMKKAYEHMDRTIESFSHSDTPKVVITVRLDDDDGLSERYFQHLADIGKQNPRGTLIAPTKVQVLSLCDKKEEDKDNKQQQKELTKNNSRPCKKKMCMCVVRVDQKMKYPAASGLACIGKNVYRQGSHQKFRPGRDTVQLAPEEVTMYRALDDANDNKKNRIRTTRTRHDTNTQRKKRRMSNMFRLILFWIVMFFMSALILLAYFTPKRTWKSKKRGVV